MDPHDTPRSAADPLSREAVERALDAMGAAPGDRMDLAEGALMLAALDGPEAPLARYRAHLADLVADVASRAAGASDVGACAEAIASVMADLHGYAGDAESYEDLQNANLMRVIDRRKGLPVALGILYAHVARAQGWDMVGLAFPSHFLVRLEAHGGRAILDPFARGRVLDVRDLRRLVKDMGGDRAELDPGFTREVADRDVLLRLQNNIKLRALKADDVARAAHCLRAMLRLAPAEPALWLELGAVEAHAGQLQAAGSALDRCLALEPDSRLRQQAAMLQQQIRRRLN
ncbi:SirB1 family protein [Zavarzinia sp. CC-PAN008]|uniref:SirB1 family protein n=1 Tax=Zavarzinia sp. CC-PAN008 TaxID=3243332 RepID=UPI003F745D7A